MSKKILTGFLIAGFLLLTQTNVYARNNMAQDFNKSVAITGGTINNTSIGATTPSTGKFTRVDVQGPLTTALAGTFTTDGTATVVTSSSQTSAVFPGDAIKINGEIFTAVTITSGNIVLDSVVTGPNGVYTGYSDGTRAFSFVNGDSVERAYINQTGRAAFDGGVTTSNTLGYDVSGTAGYNVGGISAINSSREGSLTNLTVDNININGNTVSATDTNGNLVLDANGTGYLDLQDDATLATGKNVKLTNGALQCKGAAPVFFDVITANGYLKIVETPDASAPNSSIYYSNESGKMVYKDASGTKHELY